MPSRFTFSSRLIQFAQKLDLGKKGSSMLCGPEDKIRYWYPSLYLDEKPERVDLPDKGTATIEYEVTSRSMWQRDGKESHSATIDVHSITPTDSKDKKKKLPGAAKVVKSVRQLSALRPGMIQFDSRPRNPDGQFETSATAAGPSPAAMERVYKSPTPMGGAVAAGLGGTAAAALLARKLRLRRAR